METTTAVKAITAEQKALLDKPLPREAVGTHPTKTFLSTIKAIYVTERLNDVFGVGAWQVRTEPMAREGKMVVVKVVFTIPEYGIYYECFGGNDNTDLGDAYKGATTDAITKIGSYLGIGADVFKGLFEKAPRPQAKPKEASAGKKTITGETLANDATCTALLNWAYSARNAFGAEGFNAGAYLAKHYEVSAEVQQMFNEKFAAKYGA